MSENVTMNVMKRQVIVLFKCKGKGKVFPLQALGTRKVKAPDFLDF
jgi:hypothetical protein